MHDDLFAQDTDDEVWLADVGQRRWVVLTKDVVIRRDSLQRRALLRGKRSGLACRARRDALRLHSFRSTGTSFLEDSMSKPWGTGAVLGFLFVACGGQVDSSDSTYPLTSSGASTGSSPDCAGQVAGKYELVRKRNFASPFPEPSGITYDGQDLWIMAGGGASGASHLARIEPQTLATDLTFALDLAEIPGARVGGLAWDGQSLWTASSDDDNALFRIDPATGTVTKTFSSPTELVRSISTSTAPTSGSPPGPAMSTPSTPPPGSCSGASGLAGSRRDKDYGVAVRKCEVWVGELPDNGLQIFDPENGHLLSSAVDEQEHSFASTGSMQFVGDQLVIVNDMGITYYDVVPVH